MTKKNTSRLERVPLEDLSHGDVVEIRCNNRLASLPCIVVSVDGSRYLRSLNQTKIPNEAVVDSCISIDEPEKSEFYRVSDNRYFGWKYSLSGNVERVPYKENTGAIAA